MEKTLGTVELVKTVTAVAHLADVADTVFADGEVTLRDLSQAPAMLRALKEFGDLKYADILPEAKDLTTAEATEVAAAFKREFNIHNDSIEATVEAGLDMLVNAVEAVQTLKAVVDSIRGRVAPAPAPVAKPAAPAPKAVTK